MKYRWWLIIAIALIVVLLAVAACPSGEGHTAIPTAELTTLMVETEEAVDDIVGTPGGIAYRGNVHELGKENPWPYIQSTSVTLSNWFNEINVRYRDHIETGAGETRNNIFRVSRRKGGLDDVILKLYAAHIPPGIELTQYMSGGMIGTLGAVLIIKMAPDIEPGQHTFEIGLEISGWDYGTVPCTIEVVK